MLACSQQASSTTSPSSNRKCISDVSTISSNSSPSLCSRSSRDPNSNVLVMCSSVRTRYFMVQDQNGNILCRARNVHILHLRYSYPVHERLCMRDALSALVCCVYGMVCVGRECILTCQKRRARAHGSMTMPFGFGNAARYGCINARAFGMDTRTRVSERDGRKIHCKYLKTRCRWVAVASTTSTMHRHQPTHQQQQRIKPYKFGLYVYT